MTDPRVNTDFSQPVMVGQDSQTPQQHTVPVETLRNNMTALRAFLLAEYGPRRLEQFPNLGGVLESHDPAMRVPVENVSIAINVIADFLEEPHLGLKMAEHLEKAYTRVVLFANHVGVRFIDYLRMIARYMRITSEIFRYEINLTDKEIEFRVIPISPDTASYHQSEGLCALLMRAFRNNRQINLSRIQFSHSCPGDHNTIYTDTFGVTPVFNGEHTSMFFPIECRDVPISEVEESADSIRVLQSYELQISKMSDDTCIIERCEFLLPLLLCLGEANKERLAELLCMSTRTLQRKLKERDTSFRELMQKVRVDLSEHYFLKANATCTELAFALGYQDYKQFNRAFKEWFGVAPEVFRARVLAE